MYCFKTHALLALTVAIAIATTTTISSGRNAALGVVVVGAKGKVTATDDVNLSANVRWQGPKAAFLYEWSTTKGPALPYSIDTTGKMLVVPKEDLQAGATYHIRLKVTAEWDDPNEDPPGQTMVVTGDTAFEVNTAPHGGTCTMSVRWAGPQQAGLHIMAPGWMDDDRIQYRYVLLRNGKKSVLKNWQHAPSLRAATVARPGDKLQVRCMVRDRLGDGADALSPEVQRPSAD